MKKKLLITLAIMISMAASSKDLYNDITMVSYEQSWLDYEASLSLKNNTDEEIRNISFIITYLDMDDNEIDYEEYHKSVSIAPGMTKKLKLMHMNTIGNTIIMNQRV